MDHRSWYRSLLNNRDYVLVSIPPAVDWAKVSGGRAPGHVRDLHWRCALGRLSVKKRLYLQGCTCPRGCGQEETVPHAFWQCPVSADFWGRVKGWGGFCAVTKHGDVWERIVGVKGGKACFAVG